MTETKRFAVENTRSTTYLDGGSVVNGFTVRFRIFEFDEVHTTTVPSLDDVIVSNRINKLVDLREKLNEIG